jgi:hypothetical protein
MVQLQTIFRNIPSLRGVGVASAVVPPPEPPTSFAAGTPTTTTIPLTWIASATDGASTKIYRSLSSGSGFSLLTTKGAGTESHIDTGLTPGTTYYYHAVANTVDGGDSSITTETSGTTESAPTTAPPTSFSAGSPSSTTITLNWTVSATSGATTKIYRSLASGSGFSLLTTKLSGVATHADTGLNPSTTYYYYAVASVSGVDSVPTSETSTTTTASSPGTRRLLEQGDFNLLGYFDVHGKLGGDLYYGMGFTGRRVGGNLQLITLTYRGGPYGLVGFAPPALGGSVTATTLWRGQLVTVYNGNWNGIHWSEPLQRMVTTHAIDYPSVPERTVTKVINFVDISASTTVATNGPYGFDDIEAGHLYGGACDIPQWIQTACGVGPLGFGFGGYASLVAQTVGGGRCLGPVLIAPTMDLTGLSNDTELTTSQFKKLMEVGLAANSGDPRGIRNTDIDNEYEPSVPAGRQTWGDSYWATGKFIDNDAGTQLRHGFVTNPTFYSGRAWYQDSTLHCHHLTYEFQIFDPDDFIATANGSMLPKNVTPASRWLVDLPGSPGARNVEQGGNDPWGSVAGSYYDPVTRRLYLYVPACDGTVLGSMSIFSRVYVFEVDTGE